MVLSEPRSGTTFCTDENQKGLILHDGKGCRGRGLSYLEFV